VDARAQESLRLCSLELFSPRKFRPPRGTNFTPPTHFFHIQLLLVFKPSARTLATVQSLRSSVPPLPFCTTLWAGPKPPRAAPKLHSACRLTYTQPYATPDARSDPRSGETSTLEVRPLLSTTARPRRHRPSLHPPSRLGRLLCSRHHRRRWPHRRRSPSTAHRRRPLAFDLVVSASLIGEGDTSEDHEADHETKVTLYIADPAI
jgi:hypothetical protein